MSRHARRTVELLCIFVGLPAALAVAKYLQLSVPVLPLLWLVTFGAYLVWRRDPESTVRSPRPDYRAEARYLGKRFLVCVVLLVGFTLLFEPQSFFGFPRHSPWLWLLVMVLYPLVSVLPQEFLYRTFFFSRYREVFDSEPILCFSSAVLFSFLHILFLNWVAIALTFVGGVLFVTTYRRTGSLALVTLEHSLYGCFAISVGFGSYLYDGTIRSVQSVLS